MNKSKNTKGRGNVLALVGAQYGSEGKGVVAYELASAFGVHVRTGGPNAGHSFVHKGVLYKQQVVPCGWVNPDAVLVLGAGATVDLEQLDTELGWAEEAGYDLTERLFLDKNAAVLDTRHKRSEGGANGSLGNRLGSTGKGVGACRVARVNRDPFQVQLCGDLASQVEPHNDKEVVGRLRTPQGRLVWVADTQALLVEAVKQGENVLLEGSQGSGLSLLHGPWPFVTSEDTNAAQLAANVGLPPHWVTNVVLVVRTHPIRVGGNSGPLKNELTWADLSQRLGKKVEERTTVTKKVRRVGEWDEDLVRKAVSLNAPTEVALTFLDYRFPDQENKTDWDDLSESAKTWVAYLENLCGAPVTWVGTGFTPEEGWSYVER